MNASALTAAAAAAPATDAIATASATAASRVAPYRYIHKGLRVLMAHTLQRAGALDAADQADRAAIVKEVERLLATCTDHLAHENRFFHEALRARAPSAVRPFHNDHLHHLEAISALHRLLQRLRDAAPEKAPVLAYELFLRLSVFVGENLAHMAEEESTLTQALWAHFSDAELAAIEGALHATLEPEDMAFYVHWMGQGLNASEAIALLGDLRAHAPAEVYAVTAGDIEDVMPVQRWARVARGLGLRPVHGRMTV